MSIRSFVVVLAAATGAAALVWTVSGLHAQGQRAPGQAAGAAKAPATNWTMPRTPDGRPDLQGTWNVATLTPLERPAQLKERATLSDEEAARIEQTEKTVRARLGQQSKGDRAAPPKGGDGSAGAAGNVRGYNYFW